MKRIYYLILSLCVFSYNNVNAQFDSVYVRNFGGQGEEAPGFGAGTIGAPNIRSVVDNQENVYITSYTNSTSGDITSNAGLEDILVIKVDADGELLWSQTFGGSGFDRSFSIKILNDGNILICGRTESSDGTFTGYLGGEDAFLLKLSPSGTVIWSRLYGGTISDSFFDVLELSNGDLIACGISGSVDGDINDNTYAGSNKAWAMRVSSTGVPIWSKITNGLINDPDREESFWFVKLNNAEDEVYLLGASYNFNDINSDDLFLAKFDISGNEQFKTTFGGNGGDSPAGLFISQTDEIHVLATIRGAGGDVTNYFAGNADAWLVKLSATGTIIWDKNYGGSNLDYAYGLTASDASLFISMSSRSTNNTSVRPGNGLLDGLIIEVSPASGDTLATYRWGSAQNDYSHDVLYVNENKFYAVGRSNGSDGWISQAKGGSDLILIKYAQSSLDVKNLIELQFEVYPNPTSGNLQFNIPENYTRLTIYNTEGTLVHDEQIKSSTFQTSLRNLASGVYLVQVNSEMNLAPIFKRIVLE